jgi:radical SAM superfamily enzyme with C-terminal helix-hairpin-helix motif
MSDDMFDITNLLDRASELPADKLPDVCARAARVIRNLREAVIAYKSRGVTEPLPKEKLAEIERLHTAIRRLADQDATLSACDGAVTVTMDATLTDQEREAIKIAIAACKVEGELNQACDGRQSFAGLWHEHAGALHGLLKRLG